MRTPVLLSEALLTHDVDSGDTTVPRSRRPWRLPRPRSKRSPGFSRTSPSSPSRTTLLFLALHVSFHVSCFMLQGLGSGFRVWGQGLGSRVEGPGSGFRVQGAGSGVRVQGAGSGVRVQGAGSGVRVEGAPAGSSRTDLDWWMRERVVLMFSTSSASGSPARAQLQLHPRSLHSPATCLLEWCGKIKLSNQLLPRKSGTIKSRQLLARGCC